MRVVISPVVVGDRICRIVAPVAALLEVEEWVGAWWEPSGVTLTDASHAPAATDAQLAAHGVPVEDWLGNVARPNEADIQAQLVTRDPERPEQMRFDEEVIRPAGRRRKYPGNARFRRGPFDAKESTLEAERRDKGASVWKGPWRRSTDVPPDTTP